MFNQTAFSIVIAMLAAACGNHDRSSSLQHTDTETRSLFIVNGGNNSCKATDNGQNPYASGLYKSFAEHVWKHKPANSTLIVSCYKNSEAEIYYSYAKKPDVVIEADREEFTAAMNEAMTNQDYIYMIGHSYGGWLSMKLALDSLSARPEPAALQLYSVDPISRETCTFAAPFGCTEAPADIKTESRELLASSTTRWHQYYQDRTWYLHSSSIKQADVNKQIPATHGRISSHVDTWRDIVAGLGFGSVNPTLVVPEDPILLISQ